MDGKISVGAALRRLIALVEQRRPGEPTARPRPAKHLIALSAFVLTSAAAGAAPEEVMLVVARLAQGVAAGLLTPQNTGLIQDMFRGAERGKAFGMYGATATASAALAAGVLARRTFKAGSAGTTPSRAR